MSFKNSKDSDILDLFNKCRELREKINNSVNKLSEFVLSSIIDECGNSIELTDEDIESAFLTDKDLE